MRVSRRYLPSISLLNAFEAVARTGGVSAAAQELALTQGAVSRLVQKLEAQLGVQLFLRVHRRMELTAAGQAYAPEVRRALETIAEASLALRANPGGGTLRLAMLPTMGTRWLAPLLPSFLSRYPGVTLNLTTKLVPFDFAHEQLDAAVHFGAANWEGTDHIKLFDEDLVAVAAPKLVESTPLREAGQALRYPLLHLKSRPNAWEIWMRYHGVTHPPLAGMLFDQIATLAQVAAQGIGLALLPQFLIDRELESGSLVKVFGELFSSPEIGAYYLIWPKDRGAYPPLSAFRAWLSQGLGDAVTPERLAARLREISIEGTGAVA